MNFYLIVLDPVGNEKISNMDVSGSSAAGCLSVFCKLDARLIVLKQYISFPNFIFVVFAALRLEEIVAHMLKGILSLTPTSSASVELVVLSFCLVDKDINAPTPRVITAPVCDFISL